MLASPDGSAYASVGTDGSSCFAETFFAVNFFDFEDFFARPFVARIRLTKSDPLLFFPAAAGLFAPALLEASRSAHRFF